MTSGGVAGSESGYRLAAKGREEAEDERLDLLEQLFDPGSRRRRELARPGWRCLEIGAGRGSMAVWLAERVGRAGQLVATDIDCRYLERLDLPNLQVVRHNIVDDPVDVLGPGSFDLVCARLVLFWLAGRQQEAVRQMVRCLRPGGWLIDEEGDWGVPGRSIHPILSTPATTRPSTAAAGGPPVGMTRFSGASCQRCGLQDIDNRTTASVVRGAGPWGALVAAEP